MAGKEYKGFIIEPQILEDFVHNANFQLDNVIGYMSYGAYESALIKAECFVNDLKLAIAKESEMLRTDPPVLTDSHS
jgi:hypothetical protein